MMEPYQWFWGHGMGFMWIFPLLFLIVMAVFLFRGPGCMGRGHGHGEQGKTACEIVDRRFANGEITKEQYEEMKRALAAESQMPLNVADTRRSPCCRASVMDDVPEAER